MYRLLGCDSWMICSLIIHISARVTVATTNCVGARARHSVDSALMGGQIAPLCGEECICRLGTSSHPDMLSYNSRQGCRKILHPFLGLNRVFCQRRDVFLNRYVPFAVLG